MHIDIAVINKLARPRIPTYFVTTVQTRARRILPPKAKTCTARDSDRLCYVTVYNGGAGKTGIM